MQGNAKATQKRDSEQFLGQQQTQSYLVQRRIGYFKEEVLSEGHQFAAEL